MNKGKSCYDFLKVFDIHDTVKNEKFIEKYNFNIIYTPFLVSVLHNNTLIVYDRKKKITEYPPGSEHYVKAKNGRMMLKCKCAGCGITETKFVKSGN